MFAPSAPNPNNFTQVGTRNFTPGTVLTLTDNSIGDFVTFSQNHSKGYPV